MNLSKKLLSLLLCILMIFSSVSVCAFAQEVTYPEYTYTTRYYTAKADAYGFDKLFDEVDVALKNADIHKVIEITDGISFDIDLRSVNALCQTMDRFEDLLSNVLIKIAVNVALGDLDQLSFKTWQTKLQRSSVNDAIIFKELIEFVNANGTVINKIVDGSLDLGLANKYINISSAFGEKGISGEVKKALFGIVYDDSQLGDAVKLYENNVDAFVYGPLMDKLAGGVLNSYKLTADTDVEDLICIIFNAFFKGEIAPYLKSININLAQSAVEDVRALANYVNLNGSSYNFNNIKLDTNASVVSQFNNVVGDIVKQIIPGCTWKDGDYTLISENITSAIRYLGKASGLISNADSLDYEQLMLKIMELIVSNVKYENYTDGVAECKTIKDAAKVIFINAAREMGITYEYKSTDSYLVPFGDMLAVWAYDRFDIRDNNNKAYRGGCGDDVWTVLNYILNYFLYTEGFAGYLGLDNVSKTDSLFVKLNALFDLLGSSKNNGKSFDSEKFLVGKNGSKGLLDSILTLDIENIISLTAISALNFAGKTKAIELFYNTIRYALNNWAASEIIPAYINGSAFTNLLTNENIGTLVKGFIGALNAKKSNLAVIVAFLVSLLVKEDPVDLGTPSVTVGDCVYTGKDVNPAITVKFGKTTLAENIDYIVTIDSKEIGTAKADIKFIGVYSGETSKNFKITLASVSKVTLVSASKTAVKIKWNSVAGADSYKLYNGNTYVGKVSAGTTSYTFKNLKPGTKYTFKVQAVDSVYGASGTASVVGVTNPDKVTGIKVGSATTNSLKVSWKAVSGASGYIVEVYDSAKKAYVRAGKTSNLSLTVKDLSSYTKYKFRVRAYKTDSTTVYGDYSDAVYGTTKLDKVTGLKLSKRTTNSIKLTWKAVKNAKGYTVEQYKNGKWVKLKNVTGLTCTAKDLKASTNYAFRVRAYVSSSVYGSYSDTFKVYTGVNKISSVKTSSIKTTSVKLSWKASSDASKYVVYKSTDGKNWTKVGSTEKTALTVKKLETGTKYYFKVLGYNSKSKLYSESFTKVSATTLVGKVDSLKAVSRKKDSIKLSWASEPGAKGYIVYMSTNGKKWKRVATTSSKAYTVKGLKSNTSYQFKVRAYQVVSKDKHYGAYSNILKAKTRLF